MAAKSGSSAFFTTAYRFRTTSGDADGQVALRDSSRLHTRDTLVMKALMPTGVSQSSSQTTVAFYTCTQPGRQLE